MTTPFRIDPTIQPLPVPQVQPTAFTPAPSTGDVIESGVAGVLKAIGDAEQLRQQRAELAMREQYFAGQQQLMGLEATQRRFDLNAKQQELQADEAALPLFKQWIGGGAKFEEIGPLVAQTNHPLVARAFVTKARDHLQTLSTGAVAQTNMVQARVAEPKAQADLRQAQQTIRLNDIEIQETADRRQARQRVDAYVGKLPPDKRRATQGLMDFAAAGVNLPKELIPTLFPELAGLAEIDPAQVNAFANVFRTGQFTAEESAAITRLPLPGGIDGRAKMPPPGQNSEAARKNAVALQAAKPAHLMINKLIEDGTRIGALTNLSREAPGGRLLGNTLIPQKEQQLIQAGEVFAQQWRLFITGQQASAQEIQRIVGTVAPIFGDKDANLTQKAVMREIILNAMEDGQRMPTRPATDILADAINTAKTMGVDPKGLEFMRRELGLAQQAARDPARQAVIAPLDPAPDAYADTLSAFDFGGGQ